MMTLTDQLRQAIKDSGMSLYMVAKLTHTPYAAIHGFANGQRGIKLETAERLAELFRMKLTAPRRLRREIGTGNSGGAKKGR